MTNPIGVPALKDVGISFNQVSLAISDIRTILNLFKGPQWGIFDKNMKPVIVGDSVLSFELVRDSNVSKYPVEQGGFSSYNKVQSPRGIKFTFTKGGSVSDKTKFLNSIEAAQNSLDLFVALTPEVSYKNMTIDHYDTRRTSKHGITLLTVDVWCEEVREAPPVQFSNTPTSSTTPLTNTANPESQNPTNDGTVQGVNEATQSISGGNAGQIEGSGIVSPSTISTPDASLIAPSGNIVPDNVASSTGSGVIFSNPQGTDTGFISGVTTSPVTGAVTGYNLEGGSFIPVNQVTDIFPPGYTVVQ